MITERAVKVVLAMLPKAGEAAIEHDSRAYWDLLRETLKAGESLDTLDHEVRKVIAELGQGRFSVLEWVDEE